MRQEPLTIQERMLLASDVSHEVNCQPVPYLEVLRLIRTLPYGNVIRVAFSWAFVTGARPSELANFTFNGQSSFLRGNWFFWRVGKNQKGQWRKEWISDALLKETAFYREHSRVPADHVVGIASETIGRYFNKYVRPSLGGLWLKKVATPQKGGIHEYVLQFKGLRKSFACLIFWQEYKRWKDAGVALERVASRLHHSTNHITANHYLAHLDSLGMEEWGGYTPGEILALAHEQQKLDKYDYSMNAANGAENRQRRIMEY